MQPVVEFADTVQIIRQSLWVETDFDSDRDGKLDRVHVQVTRPAAAEKAGLKIPILMLSSPYIGPTNGSAADWDVHQELGAASPLRMNPSFRAFSDSMPLKRGPTQWVSRGFAAVIVENSGTGLSTGCPTVSDSIENITPKFANDWLNGRAKGYTTIDGNVQVSAASWSNGKVGMFGTSYEGTMPLAAAVTGVQGLEAIIPMSPNTSQYRYYRSNGLVRSPRDILAKTFTRFTTSFTRAACAKRATISGVTEFLRSKLIVKVVTLISSGPSAKLYMHQGGHGAVLQPTS